MSREADRRKSETPTATRGRLGVPSGVAVVMAAMIGAGVFLSAGFMAQELPPGWILAAWGVGAVLAMAGARTYAEASFLVPRSGGEYRYLSEFIHPAVGYLAGWASLLVGFAAPTAISAYGASAFMLDEAGLSETTIRAVASLVVVAFTTIHAAQLRVSARAHNALVSLNVALILVFVGVGIGLGSRAWPSWVPPGGDGGVSPLAFATSLFYVAYAFSGWNAAAYAADEFRRPARDVPRAMLIGCASVGLLYLAVNWVFVANLTPAEASAVLGSEQTRVTLGHLVAERLVGSAGARTMSAVVSIAMLSSVSAMLLVGPRVYGAMADDGFLPRALRTQASMPPRLSVLIQGVAAVVLLNLHSVGELLANVAGVLIFFSALVAVGLFLVPRNRPDLVRPRPASLVAAAVYAGSSVWMLYNAFRARTTLIWWLAFVFAAGLAAFRITSRRNES